MSQIGMCGLLQLHQLLVGFPLLIGVLLAVGVGLGIFRPTLERVDTLETCLVDLQGQQRSLPELDAGWLRRRPR